MEKTKFHAKLLKDLIASEEFEKVGKLTCSIGLTELKKGDNTSVVFDRVDQAMYDAKQRGRNCIIIK